MTTFVGSSMSGLLPREQGVEENRNSCSSTSAHAASLLGNHIPNRVAHSLCPNRLTGELRADAKPKSSHQVPMRCPQNHLDAMRLRFFDASRQMSQANHRRPENNSWTFVLGPCFR